MEIYNFNSCGVIEAITLINNGGSLAEYIAASWATKESSLPGVARHLEGRMVLEWLAENGAFFDGILAEQWLIDLMNNGCGCK